MIDLLYSTIALLIASIEDFRKKEVSDTLNYVVLSSLLFYYLLLDPPQLYLIRILIMLFVFMLSYFLYTIRVFGGGDVKLFSWLSLLYTGYLKEITKDFMGTLIEISFALVLYIICWSVYLIYTNSSARKMIKEEFLRNKKIILSALSIPNIYLASITTDYISHSFLLLSLIFLFLPLISLLDRLMVVEKYPEELVEGDWIEEDIVIDGKVICSKRDPGLTKEQIEKLKELKKIGKIKKVKIKEGIPLIPAILLIHFIILSKIILQ